MKKKILILLLVVLAFTFAAQAIMTITADARPLPRYCCCMVFEGGTCQKYLCKDKPFQCGTNE